MSRIPTQRAPSSLGIPSRLFSFKFLPDSTLWAVLPREMQLLGGKAKAA